MTSPAPLKPVLVYDGRIGDLYRIFLINLLLNIVTLGIWRFWAITRTRRYVWSRFSSLGSRFEYDGTGTQLFVGFLLAAQIVFGLGTIAVVISVLLRNTGPAGRVLPLGVFEFFIVLLSLGAPFSAQRYRLGHTVWRGIRGGMQGSMLNYGAVTMFYSALQAITLFQLVPWVSLRLYERRINASFFGTQRFSSHSRVGKLYLRYVLTFIGIVALGVAVFGTVYVLAGPVWKAMADASRHPVDPATMSSFLFMIIPAYLVFGVGAAVISASYSAAFYRHVASHTSLGDLHFASAVTGIAVLRLIIGNLAILALSLGLGMPIVIQRNAQYFATNLLATGALDLASLGQNEQPVSRFGEGMFQVLDAGAGIT